MRLPALSRDYEMRDPPWYRMLFANTMMAPLWLVVRTYLGWQWLAGRGPQGGGHGRVNTGGRAARTGGAVRPPPCPPLRGGGFRTTKGRPPTPPPPPRAGRGLPTCTL